MKTLNEVVRDERILLEQRGVGESGDHTLCSDCGSLSQSIRKDLMGVFRYKCFRCGCGGTVVDAARSKNGGTIESVVGKLLAEN